eukprot:TRINITY_DN32612_c0_g2_i2.p1 TRINITY_DN32612_c0_g2~~TRINITY_DN32612_c0_g2_i2.p1  ORF type:complete len:1107 (-),score=285.92 TRINITY_DN32612_c0_g2_i2:428-3748(-)
MRVAKALAAVFCDGTMLFHLDLSYNGIAERECSIMAEGLAHNQTLFGIHMVGNDASVDALGFIVPCPADPSAAVERQRRQRRANEYFECIPKRQRQHNFGMLEEDKGHRGLSRRTAMHTTNLPRGVVSGVGVKKKAPDIHSKVAALGKGSFKKASAIGVPGQECLKVAAPCCWLCECWVQQRISYIPGWSGREKSVDEVHSIVAYLSIDDYQRAVPLCPAEEAFQLRLLEKEAKSSSGLMCESVGESTGTRGRRVSVSCLVERRTPCLTASGRMVRWSATRMLPPCSLPVHVVFQVNGEVKLADDLPVALLPEPLKIRLQVFPSAQSDDENLEKKTHAEVTSVNALHVWCTVLGMETKQHHGEAMDMEAKELLALEDPTLRAAAPMKPRCLPEEGSAEVEDAEWDFDRSIWECYLPEFPDCFDIDWKLTRLQRLAGQEGHKNLEDSAVLRQEHEALTYAFHYYCFKNFQGSNDAAAGLDLSGFTELLGDYGVLGDDRAAALAAVALRMPTQPGGSAVGSRPGTRPGTTSMSSRPGTGRYTRPAAGRNVSRPTYCTLDSLPNSSEGSRPGSQSFGQARKWDFGKVEACHTVFAAASVVERRKFRLAELAGLPEKGLGRYQFIEAIIRVAARQMEASAPGSRRSGANIAVATEAFLEKYKIGHDVMELREDLHKVLFCEPCDLVYREYKHMLEAAYTSYAKSHSYPGRICSRLSYGGWMQLMQDMNLSDVKLTMKDAGAAFAIGREVSGDEASSIRYMELAWEEFMVCLGALVRLRPDHNPHFFADRLCDFFGVQLQRALRTGRQARPPTSSSMGKDASTSGLFALVHCIFRDGDVDKSGDLDLQEFRKAMDKPKVLRQLRTFGIGVTDLDTLFTMIDLDGSQTVTFKEVCDGFERMMQSMRTADRAISYIKKMFADADLDQSGTLNASEISALLGNKRVVRRLRALGVAKSEIEALLDIVQLDNAGEVSVHKVVAILLSGREKGLGESSGMHLLQRKLQGYRDAAGSVTRAQVEASLSADIHSINKIKALGLKVPDFLGLFDEMDLDGSLSVCYEEFCQAICSFWRSQQQVESSEKEPKTPRLRSLSTKRFSQAMAGDSDDGEGETP